jgi:hypothetical protein|tara:strand:+ start:1787 stop:2002 length:216 start_codon:yes stop_codon:yes gene_type:complete
MYFTVAVKIENEIDGKVKKTTERYLVDAMSVTEAEARAVKYLQKDLGAGVDFEVTAAGVSRIVGVVEYDEA